MMVMAFPSHCPNPIHARKKVGPDSLLISKTPIANLSVVGADWSSWCTTSLNIRGNPLRRQLVFPQEYIIRSFIK